MMTDKEYVIGYFGFDPVENINNGDIVGICYGLDFADNIKSVIALYQQDFLYYSLRVSGNKEENPSIEAYYKAINDNLIQLEPYKAREYVDYEDLDPEIQIIDDIKEAFEWLNDLKQDNLTTAQAVSIVFRLAELKRNIEGFYDFEDNLAFFRTLQKNGVETAGKSTKELRIEIERLKQESTQYKAKITEQRSKAGSTTRNEDFKQWCIKFNEKNFPSCRQKALYLAAYYQQNYKNIKKIFPKTTLSHQDPYNTIYKWLLKSK